MISTYKQGKNQVNSLFHDKNYFDVSSIYQIQDRFLSEGLNIKCVLDGVEHYTVSGRKISVNSGKYLLTNITSQCEIEIDSMHAVQGICVNLSEALIANVVSSIIMPNTPDSDLNIGYYFNSNLFLDGEYDLRSNNLGKFLTNQHQIFNNIDTLDENFCSELFFNMTEKLIQDQIPLYKSLQSIKSIKANTKKDLMLRILRGKEYMDSRFLESMYIKDIAKVALMSEYHFYRLFREVYNESPNQYLLRKKMEFSLEKLKSESISISELTNLAGFSDIFSFSKSFKKYYGFNPSEIKLKKHL